MLKFSLTLSRRTNLLSIALCLFLLTLQVFSIYRICTMDSMCPDNAHCLMNSYCACQGDYIVNCDISSTLLQNDITKYSTINDIQNKYFTAVPKTIGKYIRFIFTICSGSSSMQTPSGQRTLKVTIWGQTGYLTALSNSNKFTQTTVVLNGGSASYPVKSCKAIYTTYFEFGQQPNGQKQELYLGVQLQKLESSQQQQYPISIKVTQEESFSPQLYEIVLTIILGVVAALFLLFIAYCFYTRRTVRVVQEHRKKDKQTNSISHFDEFMPRCHAGQIKIQTQVCSICLNDLAPTDVIRITTCCHIFHVNCIDSWCAKNLSCPICRQQLTKQFCEKMNQALEQQIFEQEARKQKELQQKKKVPTAATGSGVAEFETKAPTRSTTKPKAEPIRRADQQNQQHLYQIEMSDFRVMNRKTSRRVIEPNTDTDPENNAEPSSSLDSEGRSGPDQVQQRMDESLIGMDQQRKSIRASMLNRWK